MSKFHNSKTYRWKVYSADPLVINDVDSYIIHVYESVTGDIYQILYQPEKSRITVALVKYDDSNIIEFKANSWDDAEYLVKLLSTYENREVMPLFKLQNKLYKQNVKKQINLGFYNIG